MSADTDAEAAGEATEGIGCAMVGLPVMSEGPMFEGLPTYRGS